MKIKATACCAAVLCAVMPMIVHAQGTAAGNLAEEIRTIHDGGNGLLQKYDGSGVTIGFMDTGFDPNHMAFTKPGNTLESRVKSFYLWGNSAFELQTDLSAIATLDNVIAVGACSAVERTGYLNGTSYAASTKPGGIWQSSSYGANTFTGERLPHVVAPGYGVVSSVNRYYNDPYNTFCATAEYGGATYNWKDATGTSMATPYVSGTIALWLQADPTLTVSDIKEVFKKTNVFPEEIASLPDDDERKLRWGDGMIQPLGGLKYVLERNASSGVGFVKDDDRLLVSICGREINIFVAGERHMEVRLHSISGIQVARTAVNGNEARLDVAGIGRGIYILEVQGAGGRYV